MTAPESHFARVAIDKIDVDLDANSRSNGNDVDISDLLRSISEIGLLEPITVCDKDDGRFQLLFGHRRLRAMRELGWQFAPAMVRPPQGEVATLLANLAENLSRHQLRLYDEMRSIAALRTRGVTVEEISQHTGLSPNVIASYPPIWNGLVPEVKKRWAEIPKRDWEPRIGTLRGWSHLPASAQIAAFKAWCNPDDVRDEEGLEDPEAPPKENKEKATRRRSKRSIEKRIAELGKSRDKVEQAQARALEWSIGKRRNWS